MQGAIAETTGTPKTTAIKPPAHHRQRENKAIGHLNAINVGVRASPQPTQTQLTELILLNLW